MALNVPIKSNHPIALALMQQYGEEYFLKAGELNDIVAAIKALQDATAPDDANTWHSGSGVPDDFLGEEGDFYLDEDNQDWYKKTGEEDWTLKGRLSGPAGPMPNHQWDGTRIRFQNPDGSWGAWKDILTGEGMVSSISVSGSGTKTIRLTFDNGNYIETTFTDKDTTYNSMSASDLTDGSSTEDMVVQPKILAEFIVAQLAGAQGYVVKYDSEIIGTRNGTNQDFRIDEAYRPGSLKVYLDGVLLTKGNNADFIEIDPGDANGGARINRVIQSKSKLIFEFILK